eukprot:comp16676_c0_seq1/m.14914 comp16676_c0_seq1/g.14914  ORF comp16676_c0_seq1/g.14914 comp16676_c0_seq1/m.14914 type:complete len:271 (-) comp16676_c0_seq1:307-1119(-)
MLIKEYRICVPVTVAEYQVAQLYAVAEASKAETGGGDGVEVRKNEPFENKEYGKGQYTYKLYHLQNKVPRLIKMIAPKGSLVLHEEAWNAYPYCKTVLTNPDYMKENFLIEVITWHKEGKPTLHDNVHNLNAKDLKAREIVYIDIANDPVDPRDYKADEDPTKYHSEKTDRGPLKPAWKETTEPLMTSYKLVRVEFKWFGLQTQVEKVIQQADERLFRNFHRQLFCWLDRWHGLTMEDIRRIEAEAQAELNKARHEAPLRGTTGDAMEEK